MKKVTALLLCVILTLSLLGGCGNSYKDMRLDLAAGVSSLDPQFTTDPSARMILRNVMEGLMVQRDDGTLEPGLASGYEVSADGRTYTFTLREDILWENGTPVTAADFVFAFRRIFDPQVPSPYAGEYMIISGAQEVGSGLWSPDRLGVEAVGKGTVVFRLTETSPLFLQRLADCAAMPCNEEFFTGTRARYGLEKSHFMSNGPYRLSKWDNEKSLVIVKNDGYWDREQVKTESITFYVGREDSRQNFLDGKADCYQLSYEDMELLEGRFTYQTRNNTIWVLTFCQNGALADEAVRQAMVAAVDAEGVVERIGGKYTVTDSLVPDDTILFQQRYRDLVALPRRIDYDPIGALDQLRAWMEEQEASISGMSIMIPESADLGGLGGYFQKMWKENLQLYINLDPQPDDQFQKKLQQGNYQIALVPMYAGADSPQGALENYLSSSTTNVMGYQSQEYDLLLSRAITSTQVTSAASLYLEAEELLLSQAVVVPLFSEPSYYAMGKGVTGVELSSDGGFYLKYATRE